MIKHCENVHPVIRSTPLKNMYLMNSCMETNNKIHIPINQIPVNSHPITPITRH